MKKKERQKHDWLWLSAIILLITMLLTIYFYENFWSIVLLLLLVLTWIFVGIYILANIIYEYPNIGVRKYFLRIIERKFYTSPFFLMILGLLFLLGVIAINLICGETWGLASVVVLLVPYAGMILNIYQKIVLAELKNKKKKKS